MGARISFTSHSAGNKVSFPAGYAHQPYVAGKSYSITGPETILFSMPIPYVERLDRLGFDAGSSSTGPKDFIISYSLDGGSQFEILSLENQFLNPGGKNTYEFDLSGLHTGPQNDLLLIKLTMLDGDRSGSSGYNKTTGTFKIDNFRLEGIYSGKEANDDPGFKNGKIHYYLYDKTSRKEVLSGNLDFEWGKDDPELKLSLPEGEYFGIFIADFSEPGVRFSDAGADAGKFFIHSYFGSIRSEVYGTVLEAFHVQKDHEIDLVLERYYSEIVFEFTDSEDISHISTIEIREKHAADFWPFVESQTNGSQALYNRPEEALVLSDPFVGEKKEIRFEQFLGKRPDPFPLEYEILVYGEEKELLRSILVKAEIRNNIKLLLRGKILDSYVHSKAGFPFRIMEEWEGVETKGF